jgi:hypothetical protein
VLSRSPAASALSWLRGALHAPSPIILLLIGASLPFFGALFGYAHETAQAAETAREAHMVRNSQAANEVFDEISRRLTAIRVIAAELHANETRFNSVPQSKVHMLDSAAWEWSLAYPRLHALAEAYFGKTVAGYLEISDGMLSDEKAYWVNKIADARSSKDLPTRLQRIFPTRFRDR